MTETYEPAPRASREPTDAAAANEPFLVVEDLTVRFPTADGLVQAVTGLSYTVEQGKTLGIVGESGSGKSVSSHGRDGPARRQAHPDVGLDPGRRHARSSACRATRCAASAAARSR